MHKCTWLQAVLAAALLAGSLLAPVRPVQAGFLGRHTILGKVFRATPLGRALRTFEDRRDAYRAADKWLSEAQAAAVQRKADLTRAFKAERLDTRSYYRAYTTVVRHEQQYAEVQQRMKAIGHDNFNRALAQQVMETLGPRIASLSKFQKTITEAKDVLSKSKTLLEQGVAGIDALAAQAYPQFLRDGRREIQRALQNLEESGWGGVIPTEVMAQARRIEQALGNLETNLPEAIKPAQVVQMQSQARDAAATLGALRDALDSVHQRLQDEATVYFPPRFAARDVVIKTKTAEFAKDVSLVEQAIVESRARRALGPRLEEALGRAGVSVGDALFTRIRQRVLNLIARGKAETITGGEMDALCREALEQIEREAKQKSVYGLATLAGTPENLQPDPKWSAVAYVGWEYFQSDLPGWLDPASCDRLCYQLHCFDAAPSVPLTNTTIALEVDLDAGTVSGRFSGAGAQVINPRRMCEASAADDSYGCGEAQGAFEGQISDGTATVDADGKGFSVTAQGWAAIDVSASIKCLGILKEGQRRETLPVRVSATWRAGQGVLTISGSDEDGNIRLYARAISPPWVWPYGD